MIIDRRNLGYFLLNTVISKFLDVVLKMSSGKQQFKFYFCTILILWWSLLSANLSSIIQGASEKPGAQNFNIKETFETGLKFNNNSF